MDDEINEEEKELSLLPSTASNVAQIDMSLLYKTLENAIINYYEEKYPSDVEELLDELRKKYEEMLKQYEDKYIPFEIVYKDENGKIVKKKLNVNAKVLLDGMISKLGLVIWEELKLKMPPPEFYLLMIKLIENLFARVVVMETMIKQIVETLSTLNKELLTFSENIKRFNKEVEK